MEEIFLPKASLEMEEAELIDWLREDGDEVELNEPVAEAETNKGIFEIPAPRGGILHVKVQRGRVKIGQVIGYIGDPGEEVPGESAEPEAPSLGAPGAVDEAAAPSDAQTRTRRPSTDVPPSSPAARRRADDLGVDLARVDGTGPGGRVTLEDVERAADGSRDQGGLPIQRMRQAIARQVAQSWRDIPHINVAGELSAEALRAAHERAQKQEGNVTYTDLLLFALSRALKDVPEVNGTWEDRFVPSDEVHLGFAVATTSGVVVPVIRDAANRLLREITEERSRLTGLAKGGTLRVNDMLGGTATLSNLGGYPVDFFTPIINSPQCCLVATGRVVDRPTVRDGNLVASPLIWVNVALDHRAADGVSGGQLLESLASWFESLP